MHRAQKSRLIASGEIEASTKYITKFIAITERLHGVHQQTESFGPMKLVSTVHSCNRVTVVSS